MKLIQRPTYYKYPELNDGDVLIEEGIFLGTKEGKFGPQHYFEEMSSGEKKVLNSAGHLNYLIDDNLWEGRKCKVVYKGKKELEKGPMKGKMSHQFDLYTEERPMETPKAEVAPANTPDTSSLE